MNAPSGSMDLPFVVPQTFRLRFTDDILGDDRYALVDLLEPSGDVPPKVAVYIDEALPRADFTVIPRLSALFSDVENRVSLVDAPVVVAGGESCKNDPGIVDSLLENFNRLGLDRRSYVIAIGGGAILDVVGFAAAIAHRGIRLIRLPTTTLAQADSGVGVKNAVNWFGKKNWKGTFAVPWGVINDHSLLKTLPQREFTSGFSEVVKVTLLKSQNAFEQVERTAKSISLRNDIATRDAIRTSVLMHLDHITKQGDPFEMLEARPLDFGHWSAHRLESLSNYSIPHGEAVAIGVAIDTIYSRNVLGFPAGDVERVLRCLCDLGLSLGHPLLASPDPLLEGLEEFRQHLGGRLTLTLLKQIGHPANVHNVDHAAMRAAITELLSLHDSKHDSSPIQHDQAPR